MEAFIGTFKDSLSTVAMLAGMVVIPVIGSLMHTASTEVRALVMGATVAPIAIAAIFTGAKNRRKLIDSNLTKSREKLLKSFASDSKAELDRFRPEAERVTSAYCNTAQQAALAVIEPTIAEVFEHRERQLASDLAKAQLSSDRVMDQINLLRQLRNGISGTLTVDVKRKMQELESNPAVAKA
jgi:hypothetical protein